MPNKGSWTGSFALLSSEKLINQLKEIMPICAALAAVSDTAVRVRPVASAISAESSSGLIGIVEYWLAVSRLTFLRILVT
jgi:hypothetical protein